jgi:hypothetical protein
LGLFDSLISEEECPVCHATSEIEFQTKALINLLCRWRKGEKVETDRILIRDGTITDCVGTCPKCRTLLTADIIIKDNIFAEVLNIKKWKQEN